MAKLSRKRRAEALDEAAPSTAARTPTEHCGFVGAVNAHSAFFDSLVALVPARFYLKPSPSEEPDVVRLLARSPLAR